MTQYWDDVIYPSFRSSIRGEIYGIMSRDDADEECFSLACRAISAFKFPKVSTDYTVFNAIRKDDEPEVLYEVYQNTNPSDPFFGMWFYDSTDQLVEDEYLNSIIQHAYFNSPITYAEIEVIIAWMKVYWCELQISNADNFEDIYTDANIKTYSRANVVDKGVKLLSTYRAYARDLESRYSRVSISRKPTLGDINNE